MEDSPLAIVEEPTVAITPVIDDAVPAIHAIIVCDYTNATELQVSSQCKWREAVALGPVAFDAIFVVLLHHDLGIGVLRSSVGRRSRIGSSHVVFRDSSGLRTATARVSYKVSMRDEKMSSIKHVFRHAHTIGMVTACIAAIFVAQAPIMVL